MDDNPYSAPKEEPAHPSPASRVGFASLILASTAIGLFVLVIAHARIDRTRRRPEVNWVGPFAAWAVSMEILGWILVAVAGFVALAAVEKDASGKDIVNRHAAYALTIVLISVLGNCFFWMVALED